MTPSETGSVPHRLSALDASFLYFEEPSTPMHVAGIGVFERLDYDHLAELVARRLALVPRYRQKVVNVPGHLASPVWVDDPDFDVNYHVRRSALPRPGSDAQLYELVARLLSRRLDRTRPLWEMYLVEGLAGGRAAVVSKTHHAMVDGLGAIDIGQVILDLTPTPRDVPEDAWEPRPAPGRVDLVRGALADLARQPTAFAETVRVGLLDLRATAQRVTGALGGLAAAARTAATPAPGSPLNARISEQRRFAVARTELDHYRKVRKARGGTVNDVVLATVAGALRGWLLSRGEPVRASTVIRALVPVSVRGRNPAETSGNQVSTYLVDLPVGEPSPVMRLSQVSHAMRGHKEAGQSVAADALIRLSGFAPPTLHALAARTASGLSRRLFNVVVSNVPGPQFPLYAAGARMLEVFPAVPLAKGQAVSIGLTSYDGSIYYGLNADRDSMGDVDVLASLIEESLGELLDTVR